MYMAPERFIEGSVLGCVRHVFAGMMYLEMLTGVLPFRVDEDPVKVLLSHAYFNGVPRRLENCAWLENWRAR
jgi:serine/threonine protein kinase